MTDHDIVTARFNDWLERYAAPTHLRDKPEAAQREANALLAAVLHHAPETRAADWIAALCAELDRTATTRCWPTVREIETAAGKAHLALGLREPVQSDWRLDDAAITAKRIRSGEPFAENHLHGRVADEMLRRGLITSTELAELRRIVAAQKERWR